MLYDVRDFASVQDALDRAKNGDRLYFPSLVGNTTPGYYQAPANGWTINKSLEIFGDGPGKTADDSGTTIRPDSSGSHPLGDTVFVLSAPVEFVHLHDFKIKMPSTPGSTGTKHAISCVTTSGNKANQIRLTGITVLNHGGDAIHFEGFNGGDSAVVELSIHDCHATLCGGSGLYLKNATGVYLLGGSAGGNRKFGAYCEGTGGIRFLNFAFENNQAAGSNASYDVQLRLKSCHGFNVIGSHIEEFDNNASCKTAITVENCFGGYIGGNLFYNANGVTGSRGIFIVSTTRGITVGPNSWDYVDKLIEVNATDNNTDCVVLPQAVHATDASSPATISLPDEDGNGNFAFVPTTKSSNIGAGLLLPRITTTVRDAIPAGILQRGLVVYNSTTGKLNFYDGGAWRAVTST